MIEKLSFDTFLFRLMVHPPKTKKEEEEEEEKEILLKI